MPAALCCALLVAGCGPQPAPTIELTGSTMGTYYDVKVARPPAGLTAESVRAGIEHVLAEVNAELSTYDPASELSRLNANQSTDWTQVSPALYAVLKEGRRLGEASDGEFDITIGPLVRLWGFGPDPATDAVPSPERIRAAMARVGYTRVELREEPPTVRKARADIEIDLSALGEGVGADRMAAYLESVGASDYLAAVAGTMRVRGRNARGEPWRIAVETPTPDQRVVQRVLRVPSGAVSTSGDYRNFFEAGGRRYSHHIDPRTGASVAHRLASVTVVLPSALDAAMRADGLATMLILLGEDAGPAYAEAHDLAAYFIVREGTGFREVMSTAFRTLAAP